MAETNNNSNQQSYKNKNQAKKFNYDVNCAKKVIFLTGGVCSSVGKGVAISSIAALLKSLGYTVRVKKCDPYLNIDPGTLSPFQHGEVFVTADGVETDLDIGHYERFTEQSSKQSDYITSGRVYWDILSKERQGGYAGKTVQVIPHVTDQICQMIMQDTSDVDFLLCEIGGTVGDLEATPFYESIRQLNRSLDAMLVHVAYMPYVINEVKTKPVQHSVRELLSLGLQPDIIICRSHKVPETTEWKDKISSYANLDPHYVILGEDVKNTYEMLCMYHKAGLLQAVCEFFNIDYNDKCLKLVEQYQTLANIAEQSEKVIRIGIVGKYTTFEDSYKSLKEALFYSTSIAGARLEISWICAEKIYDQDPQAWKAVKESDGIVIPGGFGERGAEGMIKVIEYARVNNIPLLGICLGMQMIAIEAARNLCQHKTACSSEFASTEHCVIDLIDKLIPANINKLTATITGSMRVGEYETQLSETLADVYDSNNAKERFRHRYELNKQYIEDFTQVGLYVMGHSIIDHTHTHEQRFIDALCYTDKHFFIGVQYHPEFLTRPLTGHKLFNKFIETCLSLTK